MYVAMTFAVRSVLDTHESPKTSGYSGIPNWFKQPLLHAGIERSKKGGNNLSLPPSFSSNTAKKTYSCHSGIAMVLKAIQTGGRSR